MKEKTVCFTGHRKIPKLYQRAVSARLQKVIIQLIQEGYCYFGAGGALGFDTLAAKSVLALKSKFSHIKLILVLPCLSQSRGWDERDVEIYEEIKRQADKIVYTGGEYSAGCMYKRNRHLVDHSSVCVCYLTENTGGTFYTVNYAQDKNLKIINVAK